MKAIMFSNYPTPINEENVKKLAKLGVEVVRVLVTDRGIADLIIDESVTHLLVMQDIANVGQKAKVKDLARNTGRKYVGLSRQSSSWTRDLGLNTLQSIGLLPVAQRVAVGARENFSVRDTVPPSKPPPPPSSQHAPPGAFPRVVPALPPAKFFTGPFPGSVPAVGEEETSTNKQELSREELNDFVDELSREVNQYKEVAGIARQAAERLEREKKELEEKLRKTQMELRDAEGLLDESSEKRDKLEDALIEADNKVIAARDRQEELDQANNRIVQLEKELTAKKTKVIVAAPKESIWEAINAFKTLVKRGMMTADEAFDKLANHKE